MLGSVPIIPVPSALARRFQQVCAAAMAECLAEVDMTPLQYAAFPFLRDEPGLDQIGLAARIGIDRTNVGLLVDHLEGRGFVERRIDSNDRRARRLHLTSRGVRFHDRIRPAAIKVQQQILSCLTAVERETLLALLIRVLQANENLARPGLSRRNRRITSVALRSANK
jgi:DNA-binding MarR family transcriptional regulator